MLLDDELQHALAQVDYCWDQTYYQDQRLPPVNAAFSFSRNFVLSDQQQQVYDNSGGACQDAQLCFSSILQQSQLNLEESLQAVDDFDLSLIRFVSNAPEIDFFLD